MNVNIALGQVGADSTSCFRFSFPFSGSAANNQARRNRRLAQDVPELPGHFELSATRHASRFDMSRAGRSSLAASQRCSPVVAHDL
jgi:hypothetical protein